MQLRDHHAADSLASEILLHRKLYYAGRARISDEEFDALEERLRAIEPGHPVLSMVGYPVARENLGKVEHSPLMLSLDKTYLLADLFEFVTKYPVICTDKFDGMALSLEYDEEGNFQRASTRGNGRVGENVTEYVYHVSAIPKKISLPVSARNESTVYEVRGEVYFPISAFRDFEGEFDSYRNAVPGTFGRKEVEEAVAVLRVLGFVAYDLIVKRSDMSVVDAGVVSSLLDLSDDSYLGRLVFLEKIGFHTGAATGFAERVLARDEGELAEFVRERFERKRDYQIDGLVFRLANCREWEALGCTSHHPRGSIAFKQTSDVAITKIIGIEQNIGRSGKVTFRARLEPVFLSGAKISYATLHNADFIESGGYAPGAAVRIKRSGEVIPSIVGLHEPAPTGYELPEKCPCGFPLERRGPDLYCREKRPCVWKDQESLVHFVQSLEILGVSDKIILRLREAGLVREPADLFVLRVDDLEQLDGFGKKSAENVVAAIQGRRKLSLAVFLTALGLARGGEVKCREVARRFRTLPAVMDATAAELSQERGWAEKSAEEFLSSLYDKKVIVENLLKYVEVEPEAALESTATKDHPLFAKSICITGELTLPRDEYKRRVEAVGAKLVDGVSAKTDFLVCNKTSGSAKYQKAIQLGIPIVDEEELQKRLG